MSKIIIKRGMISKLRTQGFLWLIENKGWRVEDVSEETYEEFHRDGDDQYRDIDIFRCRIGPESVYGNSSGVFYRLNTEKRDDYSEEFLRCPDVIECIEALGEEAAQGMAVVNIPYHIDMNQLERVMTDSGDVLALRGCYWR